MAPTNRNESASSFPFQLSTLARSTRRNHLSGQFNKARLRNIYTKTADKICPSKQYNRPIRNTFTSYSPKTLSWSEGTFLRLLSSVFSPPTSEEHANSQIFLRNLKTYFSSLKEMRGFSLVDQGRSPGPLVVFGQTEAGRAEKNYFRGRVPSYLWLVCMNRGPCQIKQLNPPMLLSAFGNKLHNFQQKSPAHFLLCQNNRSLWLNSKPPRVSQLMRNWSKSIREKQLSPEFFA